MPVDNIQVFMPTSPAPWNPDTTIIRTAINGIWKMVRKKIPIHIYCDYPAPWTTADDVERYTEYCRHLIAMDVGPVKLMEEWCGLVGLLRFCLSTTDKPIILNVQHDWEFLSPQRVQIDALVACMLDDTNNVAYVRFHKRTLSYSEAGRYAPQFEELPSPCGVPLLASNGWGDSAHIATRKHYDQCVMPKLGSSFQMNAGRFGAEGPCWNAYRKDIVRHGFRQALDIWGSYLYGSPGDARYIRHLGDAAIQWRIKRGVGSPTDLKHVKYVVQRRNQKGLR